MPTIEVILTPTAKPQTQVPTKLTEKPTSTESNDVINILLNISTNPGEVSGNIATNEIESVKPIIEAITKPTFVTWTTLNEEPTIGNFNTTEGMYS